MEMTRYFCDGTEYDRWTELIAENHSTREVGIIWQGINENGIMEYHRKWETIPVVTSEIINAKVELITIKKWFIDTDWIPNKIVVGEWTMVDPRYIDYINERAIKRARQDELNILVTI